MSDSSNRGVIEATSIQTLVYLCEQAGTYEIPAARIVWYDLEKNALRQELLPAVGFEVEPDPEAATSIEAEQDTDASWGGPLVAAVIAGVVTCIYVRRRRDARSSPAHARRKAFEALLESCKQNDPVRALGALWH